jgi:5'-nucleotidase
MKVLLSNDDGIEAAGLSLLEDVVREFFDNNVRDESNVDIMVVAPDSDKSGSGHSLTLKRPLRLTEHDARHFSVNGTPTDCVMMAVRHIVDEKPDLMLSGVNSDANVAEDLMYSGTVAAAAEACLHGIPAIAMSQGVDKSGCINWDVARTHAPAVLGRIVGKFEFPKGVFLNINFPYGNAGDVKGVRITSQGERAIKDHVIQSIDPRGNPYFWIGPADYRKNDNHSDMATDLWAVHNGYISITPISLNKTDMQSISVLDRLFS